MAVSYTYTHPHYEDDWPFHILGIGQVLNGQARALTAAEEEAFYLEHGEVVIARASDDGNAATTGTAAYTPPE